MNYRYKLFIGSVLMALTLPLVVNVEISKLDIVSVEEQEITDFRQLDPQIETVKKSTVSSQTGGLVSEITYDVGDFVEKGSLIARISSENQKPSQARVQSVYARLNVTK